MMKVVFNWVVFIKDEVVFNWAVFIKDEAVFILIERRKY